MNAIYGIVGDSDTSELAAMGERLLHRGSYGREWSPASGVRFGERSGSVVSETGATVAFDGALDNGETLRAKLGLLPDAEPAASGSALVESLFRELGFDAFGCLGGQFAVAVWDAKQGRLVLARDRWGARSLYFGRCRGRLVFASEYKALLALPDFPARHNPDALLYAVRTHFTNPEASFLADAAIVPRGSWMVPDGTPARQQRFWDIAIDIVPRSQAEHATAVRNSLFGALRRQIGSRRKLGLALSGGLDSALVLAGMRHVAPDAEIHTFTGGYGADDVEIVLAGEVARHFGTQHHEVIVGPEALPKAFPEAVWHMEEASGGEEMTYQFLVAREAARHVDIVFTGHKADVQFAGMPRHKLLKLTIALPPLRRALEEFFHYTQRRVEPPSLAGRMLVKGYFRKDAGSPVEIIGAHAMPPIRPIAFDLPEPLSQRLRTDILDGSSKLGQTFQLHAAHGIDWNSPFMDVDMTRTAFQIPDNLKIRGLRQKFILREACRGIVPEFVLERRKSLQRLRQDGGLTSVLDELMTHYLSRDAVAARGIFQPAQVERVRRCPSSGIYSREQVTTLWQLLLTEIWAQHFLDRRGRRHDAV